MYSVHRPMGRQEGIAMQHNRASHKGHTIMIMVVIAIATALSQGSIWALPEVDSRQSITADADITSSDRQAPQVIGTINYTCPRVGRVIVHATGNLLQQPVATAEGHFVTISLTRNRLTHPPNRVHEYAPPPAGLDEGGYDISIQHAQLCDAFQQVVYRLLANKAFTAPSPAKP